jgi:hypothetical protein
MDLNVWIPYCPLHKLPPHALSTYFTSRCLLSYENENSSRYKWSIRPLSTQLYLIITVTMGLDYFIYPLFIDEET